MEIKEIQKYLQEQKELKDAQKKIEEAGKAG